MTTRRSALFAGAIAAAGALITGVPGAAPAPSSPGTGAAPAESSPYAIPFEKYALENGLEVILHRDSSLPLVAINIWYHVGPANEPAGRSGFAHLFEHLMFEGSKHVGRELDRILESVGATNVNGTTSWDRTNYYETVPRQHLELVLWLESDRMGFMLDTLTPERLEVQRDVVKNERRQRHENAPYGPSQLALYDVLFPKGHPYHGAIIGSMEDLSSATMQDVKNFFHTYYAPSNATLTIAGDFEPEQARRWIRRYFGPLPTRPKPPTRREATPPLEREVRRTVAEPVKLSKVTLGWITPPAFTKDDAILDVTTSVLAGGKATRLYQELVVKRKLAPDVSAYVDSNQLASMVQIEAMAAQGAKPEKLLSAIDDVLARLAEEGPSSEELERAKRGIEFSVLSTLQRLNGGGGESGRAGLLQRLNHYLGKPGALPEYMAQIRGVTSADVQRVVREHLPKTARVVVVTEPKSSKGGG